MICENCQNEHSGEYGSGRFCSDKCARGFSTKEKRKEINEKVSEKLKGRWNGYGFQKGYDKRRECVNTEFRISKIKNFYEEKIKATPFEKLSKSVRKRIVIKEQNGKCLWCGISEWRNRTLSLHLDHIDGNNKNNRRDNSRALCPNCHSQTNTFAGRNTVGGKKKNRILLTDDVALKECNI